MIRINSPINLALAAIGLAVTVVGYLRISPSIDLPIHWGLDGQIDATLPRDWALLQMPAAIAAVWVIFWAIDRWGNAGRKEAATHLMNVALIAVTGLLVLVQILIVLVGLGVSVDVVRAIAVGLGLMELVLGNALPKSQPNWLAGIRIPTTLRDPTNWQATHRLTGLLMMLGGIVTLVAAIVLPASFALLGILLAALLLPLVVGVAYSLFYAARVA